MSKAPATRPISSAPTIATPVSPGSFDFVRTPDGFTASNRVRGWTLRVDDSGMVTVSDRARKAALTIVPQSVSPTSVAQGAGNAVVFGATGGSRNPIRVENHRGSLVRISTFEPDASSVSVAFRAQVNGANVELDESNRLVAKPIGGGPISLTARWYARDAVHRPLVLTSRIEAGNVVLEADLRNAVGPVQVIEEWSGIRVTRRTGGAR